MKWLEVRETLVHRSELFRDYGHYDKISKKNRGTILADNNYTCRYCGGVYPKYLISIYIPKAKVTDIACRLCFLISRLNYGNYNEIKLYYSEMNQLDIVKNTVEYIIANNSIPSPNLIDKNIKTSPISVLEYINIMNNYDDQPNELKNYKIFFSNKLNIDFILSNYSDQMCMFIDTQSSNSNNNSITIKKHIPTKEELSLFNKWLN